jgi:Protein of unknown function (DUF1194)
MGNFPSRRAITVRGLLPALALALLVAAGGAPPAAAQQPVDLELVLAVDVSYSMDLDEQRLQRDGYIAAFRDQTIIKAIQSGQHGRIAVTYIEWAGWNVQEIVVPWMIVDGPGTAQALADNLTRAPISRQRRTSVTGALTFSDRQFGAAGYVGARRVIDVSGDGPNNSGPPVVPVRDALVAKGVVINGLPIILKTGGPGSMFDIPNLDEYYATCVIGGPGSFMIPIKEPHEFATATRQKLLLEISGLEPPPRVVRVADTPKIDCMIGEQKSRQYFDDGAR